MAWISLCCIRAADYVGRQDDYGAPSYGTVEPDLLYGPTGWCEADGVTVQPR